MKYVLLPPKSIYATAPTGSLRRQPRSGSLGAIISPVQVAIRITSLRKIRGIYAGEVEQS